MLQENNYLPWVFWLLVCLVGGLLIQTYLMPYWLGLGAGIIGWQIWSGRKNSGLVFSQTVVWLIGIVFLGLIGNILVSQSWQVSLAEAVSWLFVILVWQAALISPPTVNNQILIWLGGLILIAIVGIISLSTWFLPSLRVLPDMNFLYATFGHNHWSIWLLISLPWIGLADQIWPSKIWKWLVIGWLIWLFSTFGRWAIGVSLLEILVLWWWLGENKSWHRWLKGCLITGIVLLIGVFGWSSWISAVNYCPKFARSLPQLCKSIQSEQRPEYWRQAWEGIKNKPVFGSGLGTFSLVSLSERREPGGYSGYAHNDFLHWIVEAGWLGWIISGLLWLGWWKARPVETLANKSHISDTSFWFRRAIWLSAGAVLVNSLVDFDLHFKLVMIFLATSLGWLMTWKNQLLMKDRKNLFLVNFKNWWLIFMISVCLIWAGYFGITNYWWQNDQKQLVWQQPYHFPAHSFWLMENFSSASQAQQDRLFASWLGQADILEVLLTKYPDQLSLPQKIKAMENIYSTDPWSRVDHDLIGVYLKIGDWQKAQQTHDDSNNFFVAQRSNFGVKIELISDDARWRMARQSVKLAGLAFKKNNLVLGLKNLKLAAAYEPAALSEENADYGHQLEVWLMNKADSDMAQIETLNQIFETSLEIGPKYFGFNQTYLAKTALMRLERLVSLKQCLQTECQNLQTYATEITEGADWVKADLASLRTKFPHQQQLQPIN